MAGSATTPTVLVATGALAMVPLLWTGAALPAFLVAYTLVLSTIWAGNKLDGRVDWLAPCCVVGILLLLYSTSSALAVDQSGYTYMGDPISPSSRVIFYLSALAGVAGLAFGASVGRFAYVRKPPAALQMDPGWDNRFFVVALILAALIAVLSLGDIVARFDFRSVAGYHEWALSSRQDRAGDAAAGLREVFLIYFPINLILAVATAVALGKRPLPLRALAAAIIVAYLATATLSGARRVIVEAMVPMLVYWHYRIRPFRTAELAIGAVAGYLFVNLMSVARYSSEPLEMLRLVWEAFEDTGFELVGLGAASELWTATNLHRLIEGIAVGESHFTYGRSVIDEFLVLLPKVIVPGRPLSLAERFADTFYPGLLELGGGMGFFMLQEGYWAFGIVGVFLSMLIYGYVLQRIYEFFLRNRHAVTVTLVYGFLFGPLAISSVRTGLVGSMKSALLMALPLLVAMSIVAALSSRLVTPSISSSRASSV